MTTFEVIIDGYVKCRGSIDASQFTVTNVSDPSITNTAPLHELFPFVQAAFKIPTGPPDAATIVPPDQRNAVRWTTPSGETRAAEIELRNGDLFSVRRTDSGEEVRAPIHPREFWAAVCVMAG